MKTARRIVLVIFCALITRASLAQTTKQHFQLKDLRKLVNLSSPRISPDGTQIAVIVSRPDWKEDKSKQEIDLVNVADGSSRSITYNREGISEPRWSPKGSRLAFLSKDPETKKTQLFVMSMKGGDPVRITKSKTGIDEFSWSPDGKMIAFVAQDTVPNPKAIKHHEDGFKVTDENYTTRAAVQPWHLWTVSSKGGTPKRLTHGSWSIDTDQGTITPLAWSPDGKSIVFQKFPDVWYGNAWHSTLAEVDTSGGKVRTIVDGEGSGHPVFAPEGNTLAFMRPRNGDMNNGNAVYVDQDGDISDATHELARNINSYAWLPDGRSLLLTGDKGTMSVMWNQPVNGKAEQLDLGDVNPGYSLSVSNNGVIAFTGSTANHPQELYVMDSVTGKPRRLTDLNGFVDNLALGKATGIDWKGPGGFQEDGVLIYPVDYKAGKKYPLVLVIHGGPEGASGVRFSALPQLFAAKGFFVFQPNYRGSVNLGDAYQHAIYRDTGKGPGEDAMAGLKEVEKTGMIDVSRIGVSGWSYGGYMTSWLNGNYPDKWKAAVEGAALNDWVMDYTIAFYQTGDLYFFGGSPWVKKYWKIWREQSPIMYAHNVKAPTLIMGDVGDPNVPIINSYEMYHALRDNGVHTEFYAYPANTHFPHDIVRTTSIFKRWVGWMVKYVKGGEQ
ncbi:MAG TPA: S9 family peptidase [Balneolales bacterium]|nr:S9 family peptidase [Balneolales bacterium]